MGGRLGPKLLDAELKSGETFAESLNAVGILDGLYSTVTVCRLRGRESRPVLTLDLDSCDCFYSGTVTEYVYADAIAALLHHILAYAI